MNSKTTFSILAMIVAFVTMTYDFDSAYALSPTAISTGSNPVFSHAASVGNSSNDVTIPHQSGQELMVSDIFLHANSGWTLQVTLKTSSGTVLGMFRSYDMSNVFSTQLKSPLRVPAGEDLIISTSGTGVYTISGFQSHP